MTTKSFIPFPAILEATIESGALIYPLYVPSGLIPEIQRSAPIDHRRSNAQRYLTITTRAAEEGASSPLFPAACFIPIKRLEDLQKAYDDVVAQMRTAYTITYASSSDGKGSPPHPRARQRDGASVRLSPSWSRHIEYSVCRFNLK